MNSIHLTLHTSHRSLLPSRKKYPGTRFHITALMDTIVHNMSIDIGFGDVITPCPESVDFPMLTRSISDPGVLQNFVKVELMVATEA